MSTSDSTAAVAQFRKNANAILDSLVRYEFLKQRAFVLNGRVEELSHAQKATTLEMFRKNQAVLKAQSEAAAAQQKALANGKKYKKANGERWIWRALAVAGLWLLAK